MKERYQVIEKIGSGAWSDVYLVKDIRIEKLYAMKTVGENVVQKDIANRMLKHETMILRKLHHTAIPTLVDYFQVMGQGYMVMEYVDGICFSEAFRKERQEKKVQWILQCVEILKYLHAHDVIYSDLKPENIKIRNDHLVFLDFGSACLMEESILIQSGTPFYYLDQGRNPSRKQDIYSLGKMIYVLYTMDQQETLPLKKQVPRKIRRVMNDCLKLSYSTMEEVEKAMKRKQWQWLILFGVLLLFCGLWIQNKRQKVICYTTAMEKEAYKEAILCGVGKEEPYQKLLEIYANKGEINVSKRQFIDQIELLHLQKKQHLEEETAYFLGMTCMQIQEQKYYQKAVTYLKQCHTKPVEQVLEIARLLSEEGMTQEQAKELFQMIMNMEKKAQTLAKKEERRSQEELSLQLLNHYYEELSKEKLQAMLQFLKNRKESENKEETIILLEIQLWNFILQGNYEEAFYLEGYQILEKLWKEMKQDKTAKLQQAHIKVQMFIKGYKEEEKEEHLPILEEAKALYEQIKAEEQNEVVEQGIKICEQWLAYYGGN